jgi:hypothetical protein
MNQTLLKSLMNIKNDKTKITKFYLIKAIKYIFNLVVLKNYVQLRNTINFIMILKF